MLRKFFPGRRTEREEASRLRVTKRDSRGPSTPATTRNGGRRKAYSIALCLPALYCIALYHVLILQAVWYNRDCDGGRRIQDRDGGSHTSNDLCLIEYF